MSQNEMEPATPAATASPRYDRTAAAILDAAAHVLAERGAGANMAEVAAASGVSRATLYRYYPSREALLEALAAQALTPASTAVPSPRRSSGSCVRCSPSATATPCS